MQYFSGRDYIFMDVAGNFGLDKELFETRIKWTEDNLDNLESLMDQADDPIMYIKSVMALREAQQGIPSGHLVSFDACSSGMQLMGAIMNCEATCEMTGLIDPNRRADAYTDGTKAMAQLLGASVNVPRADVKQAMMTFMYGSKAEPKNLFGEDTPELEAFYQMLETKAPGACELMRIMLGSWQPYATMHSWTAPDGFKVKCPVMVPVDVRVEVDELDHTTFTHRFYENQGTEKGLSNAANLVHSLDATIVREMNRRCNYDLNQVNKAISLLESHKIIPDNDYGFVSINMIEPLLNDPDFIYTRSVKELSKLLEVLTTMVMYKPFPVICIHDAFRAHANNINHIRYWYKEMLADFADSNVMENMLSEIYGHPVHIQKGSPISHKIRNSNYALA